tara:strand:- start:110 stop:301 length:192 start_codon:yes stop_codon:yes gene_type:complete
MIGYVYSLIADNTLLGTAHCPHRCFNRPEPLCRTAPEESKHLDNSCPLRKAKNNILRKLFGGF